jgi:uncharacterized membrane protein
VGRFISGLSLCVSLPFGRFDRPFVILFVEPVATLLAVMGGEVVNGSSLLRMVCLAPVLGKLFEIWVFGDVHESSFDGIGGTLI